MWRRLLGKCFPRVSRTAVSRTRRNRWRTERLEPRLLLSADLATIDDVLYIAGTEGNDVALVRTLESDTRGQGRLLVVLNGASTEYAIETGQKIHIDLLGGNDKLDAQITLDADWNIELGEGNDETFLEALIGDRSADAHYFIDVGEGDNETVVRFGDGKQAQLPPPDQTHIVAEYRSGAGNDRVTIDASLNLEQTLDLHLAVFTGAGNDNGTMSYGGGGGAGKIDSSEFHFMLGDGDDELSWTFSGELGEVDVNADAGEGNDTVKGKVHATLLTTGLFNVDAGDGDDVIEMSGDIRVEPQHQSFALALNLTVDAGEGNDKVHLVPWFDDVPRSHIDLNVLVGQKPSLNPGLGDEVIIAFEHGDIEAPFAIGMLWTGEDQPPRTEDESPLREFRVEGDVAGRLQAIKVTIRVWDYKDHLDLDCIGALTDLSVQAMLGGGDDTAAIQIDPTGASRVAPSVAVDVDAGLGGDDVSVDAKGIFGKFALDVDLGADPENDDLPLESLTLNFQEIESEYKVQGSHHYKPVGTDKCGSDAARYDFSKAAGSVRASYNVSTSGGEVDDTIHINAVGDPTSGSIVSVSHLDRTEAAGKNETITIHGNVTESIANDIRVTMQGTKNKSASSSISVNVNSAVGSDQQPNLVKLFEEKRRTAEGVETSEIEVVTGSGDDLIDVILSSDALNIPATTIAMSLDLGAGEDRVRVDGSDRTTVGSFSKVSGLTSDTNVVEYRDGGPIGENLTLHIDLAGLESLVLKTGSGEDDIRVDLGHPQNLIPELTVCTGDGDDSVTASFVGVLGEVVFNLDTGDGDDIVDLRVTESNTIVTGSGIGSHVKAFSGATATETQSFFVSSFTGGVRVATGDINGDGVADIITGAGPGAGPHVKVFDGRDNSEIRSFSAYGSFTGGVFVAAGDINGDGRDDIITGTGGGVSSHVKVFDGRNFAEIRSFFPYAPGFTGGVRVASGDVNGDGRDDIITGTGSGASPHVKVFDGVSGAEIRSFFAYDPAFTGGVFVAAGDVNGDGISDIVTGMDAGGASHVKVFDGTNLAALQSFFAYEPGFTGGVRVAASDINGDGHADIITGAGPGAKPHVKAFDGQTGQVLRSFFAYDHDFSGGVYVASVDVGGGDAVEPGVFDLALHTGADDDRVTLEFVTGVPRLDLIGVDMGKGSDYFTLNWKGALQDPAVAQKIAVQLDLGGADSDQTDVEDIVVATFMGDDPNRPLIIGTIWNSENVGTSDNKSLRIDMMSADGILDASSQLVGGSGDDNMQLFFQGRLKVGDVGPQVRTVLDLGAGDDLVLLDFAEMDRDPSAKEVPIALDVRGGADNDALIINGTNSADRFTATESTVGLDNIADIGYAGLECLRVNALAGDDTVTMTGIDPRTRTTLDGGADRDRFIGRFDSDVFGDLRLLNFEQISMQGRGRFIGTLTSKDEE